MNSPKLDADEMIALQGISKLQTPRAAKNTGSPGSFTEIVVPKKRVKEKITKLKATMISKKVALLMVKHQIPAPAIEQCNQGHGRWRAIGSTTGCAECLADELATAQAWVIRRTEEKQDVVDDLERERERYKNAKANTALADTATKNLAKRFADQSNEVIKNSAYITSLELKLLASKNETTNALEAGTVISAEHANAANLVIDQADIINGQLIDITKLRERVRRLLGELEKRAGGEHE